jgi:hypothetical protein
MAAYLLDRLVFCDFERSQINRATTIIGGERRNHGVLRTSDRSVGACTGTDPSLCGPAFGWGWLSVEPGPRLQPGRIARWESGIVIYGSASTFAASTQFRRSRMRPLKLAAESEDLRSDKLD